MHEQDPDDISAGFDDHAARGQFFFLASRHNYQVSIIRPKQKGNLFDIVRARRLGFQKYE